MKLLICSDSHLDLISEGISRNNDIDRSMNKIIDLSIDFNVDYFMFLGDWNHGNKPSVKANKILAKWFKRLNENNINTRWLIGNHDVINERNAKHNLEHFQVLDYEYIKIIDDVQSEDVSGYQFLYLPYMPLSRLRENDFEGSLQEYILYKANESFLKPKIIVFSHLDIIGAKQGSEALMIKGKRQDMPNELINDKRVKLIFEGHYHSPQTIGEKIYCCGSIETNNFGERNDTKGFYLLEI